MSPDPSTDVGCYDLVIIGFGPAGATGNSYSELWMDVQAGEVGDPVGEL